MTTPAVFELNRICRVLLVDAHKTCIEQQHGALNFYFSWPDEELEKLGIDAAKFRGATDRLVQRNLFKHHGNRAFELTPFGLRAAEAPGILDQELPVGEARSWTVPADVGRAAVEITDTSLEFIEDEQLQTIVERDLEELRDALAAGLHKSTMILAGTIAEALLLDACDRNRTIAGTYMKQRAKFPEDASLDTLIGIAKGEGLIGDLTATFATAIKDYRDLVHPDRERRTRPRVDAGSAGTLIHLLREVVTELGDAHKDGRLEAYARKGEEAGDA